MNPSDVLVKTAKGADEIRDRAHGLHQRSRSLLIIVDGSQTAGALIERFASLGDVKAMLSELLTQGFIAVASSAPQAPASQAQPAVVEAIRVLCHTLHELLGPDADSLASRLERARDRGQFLAALERAQDTVGAMAGAKKAGDFRQRGLAIAELHFPN